MGNDLKPLAMEIDAAFESHGAKPCILDQQGEVVSFATYFKVVLSLSERLRLLGVKQNSLVAVTVQQYALSFALRLALLRLGATIFSMREVDRTGESGISIDKIISLRERPTGHPREVFFSPDWITPPMGRIPPQAGGGFVHATSGSSGVPKLRYDSDQVFLARIASNKTLRGLFSGPVFNAQNIATLIGQKVAFGALLEGQMQISLPTAFEDTFKVLHRFQVTDAYIPPSHLRQLLMMAKHEELQFSHLNRLNVGGGAVSQEFARNCEEVFSTKLYSDYGSTETDTIATARVVDSPTDRTIFTQFYPGVKIKLDATQNNSVRVWIPNERRTMPFLKDEVLFDQDGWITLDDIGLIQENGILEILGRSSEIINAGGNKFAPHVLEALADNYPGIKEIAAFKIPTASHIDAIGIAAVFEGEETPNALRNFLSKQINIHHELRVYSLPAISKTEGGKIDRGTLTKMALLEGATQDLGH